MERLELVYPLGSSDIHFGPDGPLAFDGQFAPLDRWVLDRITRRVLSWDLNAHKDEILRQGRALEEWEQQKN
ncbi:hypothetical protein V2J09_010286 [Rumex salicifolius]